VGQSTFLCVTTERHDTRTQKTNSRKLPAQHKPRLSRSTPPLHQNLQPQLLHNMQSGEHTNGQRSPLCVTKTIGIPEN
jgi:hypothetical protein